jgi:hypothetical protein
MSDNHDFTDSFPRIIENLVDRDRLPFLVITGLFYVIIRYVNTQTKKNEEMMVKLEQTKSDIELKIEESKHDIQMQIADAKGCVLQILYDLRLRPDRRYHDTPVDNDKRRHNGDL